LLSGNIAEHGRDYGEDWQLVIAKLGKPPRQVRPWPD